MNTESLVKFLLYCGREGCAALGEDPRKEADGSRTIILTRDDWQFHDNYFGGEPFGGREVASYKGKPLWMMVYYGRLLDKEAEAKSIYGFLKRALAAVPDEAPYRGPEELAEGDLVYQNHWSGTPESFSGQETISQKGREVYRAQYAGGLVDQ